jgi:4-coumarate--CoA ligase
MIGLVITAKHLSRSDVSKRDVESFRLDRVDPLSAALLPFSSGISNTMQLDHIEKYGKHMLGVLPFFHIYSLLLIHLFMYQGSTLVVLPKYEPATFLHALAKYQVRHSGQTMDTATALTRLGNVV